MLPNVVRAYADEGHVVRLGSPRLLTSGVQPADERTYIPNHAPLPATDWGFTVRDFYVFELLARCFTPQSALVIGNAYGISAVSIGALFDPIRVDVIDAELCGETSRRGAALTRAVATRLGLDLRLTTGFSPRDLDAACRGDDYGIVFVDGDHTNAQVVADYTGVRTRLADQSAVVFHDVGLWKLDEGWRMIREDAASLGFTAHDLVFTDFGSTVLVRDVPELQSMLETCCAGLRDLNEQYQAGWGFRQPETPERAVYAIPPGGRVAFYGAGHDLTPYRDFIERHPESVAAILDDDASLHGTERFGVPIVEPSTLPSLDVAAVVVSTNQYQLPVRIRLAQIAPEIPVEPGRAAYPNPGLPGPVQLIARTAKATPGAAARPEPAVMGAS